MSDTIPAYLNGALAPVDKIEVHVRGLKHPAVSVFVVAGSEVLIQKRASEKYHTPGRWTNTCCTHPAWKEDPLACAVRRLREELGITGLAPRHRDRLEYRAEVGGGMTEHEVVDIFVAEADRSLAFAENPNEVAETRWVDLHDLVAEVKRHPETFTPWLKIYLGERLPKIFAAGA